jgi:hypothetical protein
MQHLINKTVFAGLVSIGLFLVGCASTSAPGGASANAAQAMNCPKCKTTWVTSADAYGTKATGVQRTAKMDCPDCDANAASTVTKGGQLRMHNCAMCLVTAGISPGIESTPIDGIR